MDLDSGESSLLAGGADNISTNYPVGFDDASGGIWLVTNDGNEFNRLAWQASESASAPEIITADIPWDVTGAAISHDRSRMAFTTNEDGRSRVYLLDPLTREYRRVDSVPIGLAFGLEFSPDDTRIAMTLNTVRTPSDAFVLSLGEGPLEAGELTRWTESEVGGLDASKFREPQLEH